MLVHKLPAWSADIFVVAGMKCAVKYAYTSLSDFFLTVN